MGGLSWWHWVIILGAFVLLFGAKKLPEAARGVGRSLRILKSEVGAMSEDGDRAADKPAPVEPAGLIPPAPGVGTPLAAVVLAPAGAATANGVADRRS